MSNECVFRGSMRRFTLTCCESEPIFRWICRCLKTEEGTPKDCVPSQVEYDRQFGLMPEGAKREFVKRVTTCEGCPSKATPTES